jgi:hypothetical protein
MGAKAVIFFSPVCWCEREMIFSNEKNHYRCYYLLTKKTIVRMLELANRCNVGADGASRRALHRRTGRVHFVDPAPAGATGFGAVVV